MKCKPCPFCGNDDTIRSIVYPGEEGFRDRFAIRCDYSFGGCGAEGGWRHSEDEAIDVWNGRATAIRGSWIETDWSWFNHNVTQVQCNQCKNYLNLDGLNGGRGDANYCPNCGAYMRVE